MGPAIIENVVLSYQSKNEDLSDYDSEFLKYLKAKTPILDSITAISYSTLDKGIAIPAGTKYNILTIFTEKDYKLYKATLEQLIAKGLYFEINYKSLQDEHWRINNVTKGPEKLN